MVNRPLWAGLSVGLGICSLCRAPGAYYRGVWVCDSCSDPAIVHARITAERVAYRARGSDPGSVGPMHPGFVRRFR